MAHTHPPSWIQRTSQNSTESEASKIDRLQQSNSKLTTENRWLRNVIRELEVANTLAGVEKRLSKTSIGIFEKVDLKYEVDFSDAQREQKKTWTGMLANIHLQRAAFDATGLESSRELYESAIKSWQTSFTRKDDIEMIILWYADGQRARNIVKSLSDQIILQSSDIEKLKSMVDLCDKDLKQQGKLLTSARENLELTIAQLKSAHEKELKEQRSIIADMKAKEKISTAETTAKYEKALKEHTNTIADMELKGKAATAEIKSRWQKKLKEQSDSFEEKEKTLAAEIKSEYEKKLKEQINTISKLEKERTTSTAELRRVHRELAAHSQVSVSILGRKRELMKPFDSRDDHIIEAGNLSAHGGTCVADALRVKSDPDIDDSQWFEEQYGVAIDVVERFGESAAFAKLLNMRYDMYNSRSDHRADAADFEAGFQSLLASILNRPKDAAPESIDGLLLKNQTGRETFQKLCSTWDTIRAPYRKRESRDLRKRSIFSGSLKSSASVMTSETARRTKLDKIEEYGKDILSSAKDAMPWAKR